MVQLRNISKRFGAFMALQEVSFEIAEGEFMTFLGPSGCGKTTCLRLISGFDTLNGRGFDRRQGCHLRSAAPAQRESGLPKLCAVSASLDLREYFLRLANEEASRSGYQEARRSRREMTPCRIRDPNRAARAQRQRVALRAIVCEPKVLLLDEPSASMRSCAYR